MWFDDRDYMAYPGWLGEGDDVATEAMARPFRIESAGVLCYSASRGN